MKNEVIILINTIDKVKKFVNINNSEDMDIYVKWNRYIVDAKSIMGIFSLNLNQPVKVYADCDNATFERYCDLIKDFLVM